MSKIDSRAPSVGNAQITLTEDEKKFFSDDNNFIEYFIEIGVTPNIFSNNNIQPDFNLNQINSKLKPEIISKFPHFDKQSMAIDSTIIEYIFPKEYKAIFSKSYPQPEFYSLVLDNQFYSSVYSYKYISCLVIYESLLIYKQIYDTYSNKSNDNSNISQDIFKNIYVPKCLCLASVHPSINKFELILRALYENFQLGKNYFFDLVIEKLVSQTPKIPKGLKKIYLKINEGIIDLTETKMNELTSVNINLKELFSLFKIDKIVDIFRYLLYEIKIVFFSSNLSQVTNIIMSFLILLKPFTYQYRILSVLPKDSYFFLEDDNPCVFGVNELYYENFFKDNNLFVENKPICIVDIDNKECILKYGRNSSAKSFPVIPKHLKEKLDKRTEEFKKRKKKEETNEGYQEIFFRFMINLLKDYPKFLKKTFNGDSYKVQDMIDKPGYINSQSSGDKEFYEKIIYSQMFDEFITKRMMPRDTKEKIQALFFEEKLNVKHAQKKLIRGNKILEQNVLLPSKDYDYKEPREIIDLTETGNLFSKLDSDTIKFFYNQNININNEVCLPKGFYVSSGKTQNEIYFKYYIFPALLSDKLFKFNCKHYIAPQNFNFKVAKINENIINNCFIKFDDGKKNKIGEYINDIYISYIILFSLCFWYTDKEERETRFNNMNQILNKIVNHDMEVTELLFNTLIKLGEEQLASYLYSKFNQMHINLTWKIFSLMSKILHKKQNEILKECKSSRGSMHFGRSSMHYALKSLDNKNFRSRTIKLEGIDDNILGEEILFDAFGVCLDCKNDINLQLKCKELLSEKELDKMNRFKCKCNNFSLQKLNFKIGTELYNPTISKNSSSLNQGIILCCPTTLKKKLLNISNLYYNSKFDVENFRINYPDEFWNAVWYFKLKEIDISFMLPYVKPTKIKIVSGINKMSNFINFITSEVTNINHPESSSAYEFKNPNNKVEKIKKKKIIFNKDTLYIQHVYQMSIIKIIGMIMYKSSEEYSGNISYNERILMVSENKKDKSEDFIEEKKETKKKSKKNIMFSNNIIINDLDLTTSTSTINIDNSEEYNKLMDGTFNIEDENDNINKVKKGKQSKVHFSTEELFENIKEDDAYYNAFKDYREDEEEN